MPKMIKSKKGRLFNPNLVKQKSGGLIRLKPSLVTKKRESIFRITKQQAFIGRKLRLINEKLKLRRISAEEKTKLEKRKKAISNEYSELGLKRARLEARKS